MILDYSDNLQTLIFLTRLISVFFPRSYYMSCLYLRNVALKDTNLPHLVTCHLLSLGMDCYHHALSEEL